MDAGADVNAADAMVRGYQEACEGNADGKVLRAMLYCTWRAVGALEKSSSCWWGQAPTGMQSTIWCVGGKRHTGQC